mmetsp:Transcript_3937/g.6990  ORF Transcript_3937/g.6990 Transcript_3937/m.6990 type:complete len:507 (+) Transcript_3937:2-1522(+)
MPAPSSTGDDNSKKQPAKVSNSMRSSFSSVPGIDELSSNRPPLDHSITRRKKTAGTVDRRDSAPPSWHSEAADLPHRQAMVQDIAKLLYARKKGQNPGRSWLERVPLKAKMLESQLYKNAASLEAYLNRSTLKIRLGKLASAITSHYKHAVHTKRGSSRSSSGSISSLASLENAFADAKLRRESSSSASSLPVPINSDNRNGKTSGQSDGANKDDSNTNGGMPFAPNLQTSQNESLLESSQNNTKSTMSSGLDRSNPNAGQNAGVAGMNDAMNNGMASQQQQFLSSIRQQQQELTRRIGGGNSNNLLMNTRTMSNPSMGMMGGGNFPMLNQQVLMQQQQNTMNMNMLQQQNMFLQQQQQQQQQQSLMTGGLSLHNISIMQQQQQRQLQQHPSNNLMGFPSTNNAMSMNMMNSNLPPVIPGAGISRSQSMHATAMNSNNFAMGRNTNNMPDSMDMPTPLDSMSMPPPGMPAGLSFSTSPQQQRHVSRNNSSNNDEPASPLSPGSFNW